MKLITNHLIILTVFALLFAACKQSGQTQTEVSDQEMIEKSEIEQSLKDISNPLPQPFEVYNMLEDIGASYLGDVLNPVSNLDNYFSAKSKAVSAGVYAADLGYAATYDNRDDIGKYSKTLKLLIDDLGVKVDYSAILQNESKESLVNKDSLINFISSLYYDTYSFLYKESSPSLAALMAAGAWTEGMYIATHISEDTYQNTDIISVIYKQSESLADLIKFLDKFKEDEMVGSLLSAFQKLKNLFDETGGNLSKTKFEEIVTSIEAIRESMIY